jgi:hypothetical protein
MRNRTADTKSLIEFIYLKRNGMYDFINERNKYSDCQDSLNNLLNHLMHIDT